MKAMKLLFAATAALTMAFTAQAEKTAKAVLADGGATLRFVYDEADYGTKDRDWFSVAEAEALDPSLSVPWAYEKFARVEFDPSFAPYKPKQCCKWFDDAKELADVSGLSYLDVSEATNFSWMFANCSSLMTLDLSGFDMKNATHCYHMFAGCGNLRTIYALDRFVLGVGAGDEMFKGCTSLVGGKGTEYDATAIDATYARIDGGTSAPGYFTAVPVYRIQFKGGSGAQGTMADQICARDKVCNLAKCAFTKGGSVFKGWAGDNERRYDDGVLVFNAAAEGEVLTLTAIWELGGVQLWADGPYWADCNVDATKPEDSGSYFWWGDTVGYKRVGDSWDAVDGSKTGFTFMNNNCPTYIKDYAALQTEGYVDAAGNLTAKYDAATAHLGAPWRMPTDAEFSALASNCDREWTARNGVNGWLVKGRGADAAKCIFLPAVGYVNFSNLKDLGSTGYYWSSTSSSDVRGISWSRYSDSSTFSGWNISRYYGCSVRPVRAQ